MLTNPDDVQEVIRGLKVSKAPDSNGIAKGPWSISHSQRYPSWSKYSTRPSSLITSLQRGNTLEWSLYL